MALECDASKQGYMGWVPLFWATCITYLDFGLYRVLCPQYDHGQGEWEGMQWSLWRNTVLQWHGKVLVGLRWSRVWRTYSSLWIFLGYSFWVFESWMSWWHFAKPCYYDSMLFLWTVDGLYPRCEWDTMGSVCSRFLDIESLYLHPEWFVWIG